MGSGSGGWGKDAGRLFKMSLPTLGDGKMVKATTSLSIPFVEAAVPQHPCLGNAQKADQRAQLRLSFGSLHPMIGDTHFCSGLPHKLGR